MKKILLSLIATIAMTTGVQADMFISGSETLATDNVINLTLGDIQSIYVWADTDSGQSFSSISFNVTTDTPDLITAVDYSVTAPAPWASFGQESLNTGNLLVNNGGAFNFLGGFESSPGNEFFQLARIDIQALAGGSGNLGVEIGGAGIGITPPGSDAGWAFNSATVNVSAVPEPGTFAVLGVVGSAYSGYRIRRRKQKQNKA
ncbi:PEP-CTERM sorting domain-containing protein [Crateriforma spongiae]|uniref:PEP-CTERM sorting domain-containing protein n=1 Tax=Crateriforma spongiae TaxID=2724528 RepID=UPI0039B0F13A